MPAPESSPLSLESRPEEVGAALESRPEERGAALALVDRGELCGGAAARALDHGLDCNPARAAGRRPRGGALPEACAVRAPARAGLGAHAWRRLAGASAGLREGPGSEPQPPHRHDASCLRILRRHRHARAALAAQAVERQVQGAGAAVPAAESVSSRATLWWSSVRPAFSPRSTATWWWSRRRRARARPGGRGRSRAGWPRRPRRPRRWCRRPLGERGSRPRGAACRRALHVRDAAHHHLRRVDRAGAEPARVGPLPGGERLVAERVGPAEVVPVGDVELERQHVLAPDEAGQHRRRTAGRSRSPPR